MLFYFPLGKDRYETAYEKHKQLLLLVFYQGLSVALVKTI